MKVTVWACIVAAAEAYGVATDHIADGRTRDPIVIKARRAAWSVASDLMQTVTPADLGRATNINRKTVQEGIGIIRRRAEWCDETAATLANIEVRALDLGCVDRSVVVTPEIPGLRGRAVTRTVAILDPAKVMTAKTLRRKGWSLKGIAKHLELDARAVASAIGEDPNILGGDRR